MVIYTSVVCFCLGCLVLVSASGCLKRKSSNVDEKEFIGIAMDYIDQKWPESLISAKGLDPIVSMIDGSCEVTFRLPKDTLGGVPVVVVDRQTKKVIHAHHTQ